MAKNLHMEHLEDEILNKGVAGGREAIKILKEMGQYLTGGGGIRITTKFDGAPAILAGTDPEDGRFFVSKKGNNPKLIKSKEDAYLFHSGGLAKKLATAFEYLQPCKIKGVLQGDIMFTSEDKKKETIKGEKLLTFRTNTISYAVDPDSKMGKEVAKAKLGVVFHTRYSGGTTVADMDASFDVKKGDFQQVGATWLRNADYEDASKAANFTSSEKAKYDAAIRRAEGSLQQAGTVLNEIQSGKKVLKIDTEFKKFFNRYVRDGQSIPSVEKAYTDFAKHLGQEYDKVISKNKTLKSQADKAGKFMEDLDFLVKKKQQIKMLIASYMNIQYCKNMLVNKLKKVSNLKMFVNMGTHYDVTTPEGFVAISGPNAVKLVDRMEFSRLNFVVPKIWT